MTPGSRDTSTKGKLRARAREQRPLPGRGKRRVYLLTCAQNNTLLHETCWQNLRALADYEGAEILVASVTYAKPAGQMAGQKKSAKEAPEDSVWWAPEVEPYLVDRSVQLAPGLVWCGELNILPTAVNPISGLESYTGRDSSILPHVKFSMRSIPSPKMAGTKLIYTTGCVTLRNYIQKKAGQKAEFHHGYGGLIVEVCHDGAWYVRQLNADSEGVIYDLDRRVDRGRITLGHRPDALVWGDIHTRQLDPAMRAMAWGADGMLDTLRPRRQVLHDILDFRSQSHHDRKDAWKVFAKHCEPRGTDVVAEVAEVAQFLNVASRPWCESVVVCSNHDLALVRWLKEADYREDPGNALFQLEATLASYSAMREKRDFYAVEWAVRRNAKQGSPLRRVRFLRRDEEYVACPEAGGGIELGMHGDKGANGAKGSLVGFARTGRKCVVADSHTAGIQDGAYQVGVMGRLDQGYNEGQSSWSHTNCLIYPNGKRALVTIWRGRWRG